MTTESRPLYEEVLGALKAALKALDSIGDEMTVGERYTNAGQYLIDALEPVRSAIAKLEAALPLQPVAMVVVRRDRDDEFYWSGAGLLLELAPGEYDLYFAHPVSLPQQEGEAIPKVLFDGYYVWDEGLTDGAKKRTSPENVADVLDAVVRLMRKEKGTPHA